MRTTTLLARALGRLFSAVVLCLALVVSQIAHASAPPSLDASSHAMTASHAMMPTAASHAHDAGQTSGHERHGGGRLDQTCATQCPSVFVQPDEAAVARAFDGSLRIDSAAEPLAGTIVPAPERPPRA